MRIELTRQMASHPERSGIQNCGEAVQLVIFSTFVIDIIFSFVTAGYAIGVKVNKFYLSLLPLIILPLILLGSY